MACVLKNSKGEKIDVYSNRASSHVIKHKPIIRPNDTGCTQHREGK